MKKIVLFLIICCTVLLQSCSDEEIFDGSDNPQKGLVVYSGPLGMAKVVSRSHKDDREALTTSKTLVIFDANGKLVKTDFKYGQDATFVIDRKGDPKIFNYPDRKSLDKCRIYVVANFNEGELNDTNIPDVNALMNYRVKAESLLLPSDLQNPDFKGLPMIGVSQEINLNPESTLQANTTHIYLKSLYSKITMDVKVKPDQVIPGKIVKFKLNRWTVKNIPSYTLLGEPAAMAETPFVKDVKAPCLVHNGERKVLGTNPASGDNGFVFSFYVLEHKVNPEDPEKFKYPAGVLENEKQRFKPKWLGKLQRPLYVYMEGEYFDHQGHSHNARYSLYLGENNHDNFFINRNCQYLNSIIVRGLTNHDMAGGDDNISIDHRVNIVPDDVEISIERETMLDSHYEIRPVDIDIKSNLVKSVNLDIVNPRTKEVISAAEAATPEYNWIRFEKKHAASGTNYCSNGKRKYFTTDLVTVQLKDSYSATVTHNSDNRIWIYCDENLYASKNKTRDVMLRFRYNFADKSTKDVYMTVKQHDLYPVSTPSGKKYYIEYYEEYLYSFDPKDPFSNRTDGMKWGMSNVLYSKELAIKELPSWLNYIGYVKRAIQKEGGKYDYENLYSGYAYTKKLIEIGENTNPDSLVNDKSYYILPLDKQPRSAAEYCYNKNKRDAAGNVTGMSWYLPAIGELQEITVAAYSQFKVFQDKYYWSSQTSYNQGRYSFSGFISSFQDFFLIEDLEYARATKTYQKADGSLHAVTSERAGSIKYIEFINKFIYIDHNPPIPDPENDPPVIISDPGNHLRSDILRVRAVRQNNNDIIER